MEMGETRRIGGGLGQRMAKGCGTTRSTGFCLWDKRGRPWGHLEGPVVGELEGHDDGVDAGARRVGGFLLWGGGIRPGTKQGPRIGDGDPVSRGVRI